ncbi:PIR protein [Plasmodium vivax]|nr:PIR protein [Plasmodium vivax]
MGFSQWIKNYKFLEGILNLYDELDRRVEDDKNKEILKLCDKNNTFNTNLSSTQEILCRKLLRNFFLCSLDFSKMKNCCSNLYVWLHYEIMNTGISNDIIQKIFEFPKSTVNVKLQYFSCPYVTFNEKINNPENLMKLSIFNDNADTFESMLKDSDQSKVCYLKKYIYECVNIYKDMNRTYKFFGNCKTSPHKYACDIINEFHSFYTQHILNKQGNDHNFPELSSDETLNVIDECPVEESDSILVTNETPQGTPTTGGVSTALSAMVGIPPFLALIYKLFRFENKNNMIITSDFDKKMENELFHVVKEDSNIKDIQTKYNIEYEPI